MKVTVGQVAQGVATYIDRELVPKVPGIRKWVLGISGAYAGKMIEEKVDEYRDLLISIGVMEEDGMIDIDTLASHLKKSAAVNGPVTEHFPMLGDITFDSGDVDKLHTYIVS